jgi:hypothetical protein
MLRCYTIRMNVTLLHGTHELLWRFRQPFFIMSLAASLFGDDVFIVVIDAEGTYE